MVVGGPYQKLRPGTRVEDPVLVILCVEECERIDPREAGKGWDSTLTILFYLVMYFKPITI